MLPLRLGLWQLSAKVVSVTLHQMFLELGVIPLATHAISSIAHVVVLRRTVTGMVQNTRS
jgi:hypothetical protein